MKKIEPELGMLLRSLDGRDGDRVVRVIEVHRGVTGVPRQVRVENTLTERRTFLRWPVDHNRWHVDGENFG